MEYETRSDFSPFVFLPLTGVGPLTRLKQSNRNIQDFCAVFQEKLRVSKRRSVNLFQDRVISWNVEGPLLRHVLQGWGKYTSQSTAHNLGNQATKMERDERVSHRNGMTLIADAFFQVYHPPH
jgi:hypothetical protein